MPRPRTRNHYLLLPTYPYSTHVTPQAPITPCPRPRRALTFPISREIIPLRAIPPNAPVGANRGISRYTLLYTKCRHHRLLYCGVLPAFKELCTPHVTYSDAEFYRFCLVYQLAAKDRREHSYHKERAGSPALVQTPLALR